MPNPLAEATTAVIEILTPFDSADRLRVIQAALMLLGENTPIASSNTKEESVSALGDDKESPIHIHQAGKAWVKKYRLSHDQLNQVFLIDQNNIQPIALSGLTKKKYEQVGNTYLIQGIAGLLKTGEASFSDDEARKLCGHFGCYDTKHHSESLKDFANKITGSKATGWKLTAPGLAAAADLMKQLPANE